ncbi:MAG: hypothetical protein N4A46_03620 [Schleiferiaceae bacterium]|jgi:hypothetical protein|nr:hypothetical protein [Schleiferiaceae bacterium]
MKKRLAPYIIYSSIVFLLLSLVSYLLSKYKEVNTTILFKEFEIGFPLTYLESYNNGFESIFKWNYLNLILALLVAMLTGALLEMFMRKRKAANIQ